MNKKSITVLCLASLLVAGGVGIWWTREASIHRRILVPPATGIVTTAIASQHPFESYSKSGDVRPAPSDPVLADALSHTSKLDFRLRLKAVHALQGLTLSGIQADLLRSFVADPAIPEGLTIQQVRALKNDVLNVLCVQLGGEAATAAMLRALYADTKQDTGLRDYALQHLVTLSERDQTLGWATHWQAIEGTDANLAATAMLHLVTTNRDSGTSYDARLSSAALRLANDTMAPASARTTAIQVCGRLKLTEARSLVVEIARSGSAAMPLRIAAIAALGDLGGDASTRDYIAALVTGPERRLRVPAESALKRFSIN